MVNGYTFSVFFIFDLDSTAGLMCLLNSSEAYDGILLL